MSGVNESIQTIAPVGELLHGIEVTLADFSCAIFISGAVLESNENVVVGIFVCSDA